MDCDDALDNLHQRGMGALVLDLRNNPGGLLDQAIRVASAFCLRGRWCLRKRAVTA